jgi:hypothetical protein
LSAVAHIKDYKAGKFYQDDFWGDISWIGYEHKVLLRNEGKDASGTLQFTDIAMALGADDIKDVRGMAIADFDNDGALDIIMNSNPGDSGDATKARPALLRNNIGSRRNWLAVELTGTQSNRDAVGAMVTIETGGAKQLRLVSAGSGIASQNSERLYFGLNDKSQIDALTVRWPSGRVERFNNIENQPIAARHVIRITEGTRIEQLMLPAK